MLTGTGLPYCNSIAVLLPVGGACGSGIRSLDHARGLAGMVRPRYGFNIFLCDRALWLPRMGPPSGHPIHPPGGAVGGWRNQMRCQGEGGGALIVVGTLSENDGSFDKLSAGS